MKETESVRIVKPEMYIDILERRRTVLEDMMDCIEVYGGRYADKLHTTVSDLLDIRSEINLTKRSMGS